MGKDKRNGSVKRLARYIYIAGLIVLLIVFWNFLWPVIAIILISIAFAYITSPAVTFLKKYFSDILSIIIVYIIIFVMLSLLSLFLIPAIIDSIKSFSQQLPEYFSALDKRTESLQANLTKLGIGDIGDQIKIAFADWVKNLFNGTEAINDIIKWIGIIGLTPVFSFFFIKDKQYFVDKLLYLIPSKNRYKLIIIFKYSNNILRKLLKGQIIIALSCGALSLIGFIVIGLPKPFILAVFMAVCSIIPYFGPIAGSIPPVLVAAPVNGMLVWYSVIVVLITQQIVGGILAPKLLGKKLGMHPLLTVTVLIIGMYTFGLPGIILSLPIYIVINEDVRFIITYRSMDENVKTDHGINESQ